MPLSLSVATERTNPIISQSFFVANFAIYIAGFAICISNFAIENCCKDKRIMKAEKVITFSPFFLENYISLVRKIFFLVRERKSKNSKNLS